MSVLDHEGESCDATVSVTHLPDRCVAEEADITIDLTRAPEPTIFEFEIRCGDEGPGCVEAAVAATLESVRGPLAEIDERQPASGCSSWVP